MTDTGGEDVVDYVELLFSRSQSFVDHRGHYLPVGASQGQEEQRRVPPGVRCRRRLRPRSTNHWGGDDPIPRRNGNQVENQASSKGEVRLQKEQG